MWYSKQKWTTAKKTTYNDKLYDSKFEASCAFDLDMRKEAGEIESWEPHHNIELIGYNEKGTKYKLGNYKIDFIAYRKDGVVELIEAKGVAGDSFLWRLKWRILEMMYGDDDHYQLIVLWQKTPKNYLRKAKKI